MPKNLANKAAEEKPIGEVTHFFGGLSVAIIKFKKPVGVGEEIHIKGATTDFKQKISSMQYDHQEIQKASPNKEVGIKVNQRAREGDQVFV